MTNRIMENLILNAELGGCEWGEFYLNEIFTTIQRGKRLTKENQKEGTRPYVSSSKANNGVDNFISNDYGVRIFSHCISLANSGSVGSAFFHEYEFVASDHITILHNESFNKYIYLFMLPIINRLSEKYSFNREINDDRIKREKILLPKTKDNTPDFAFMEKIMKRLESSTYAKVINYYQNRLGANIGGAKLESLEWREFRISDLFEVKATLSGIDKNKLNGKSGKIPYITRTDRQNGVDDFVATQEFYRLNEGNVITIGLDTQTAFYQQISFYTGQNIQILYSPYLNKYNALFILKPLKILMEKFNWGGNGATLTRLKRSKIFLPIDSKGQPHWEFMESFMRKIENKQLISYLRVLDKGSKLDSGL